MAPKQDRVYARECSKSVAQYVQLVIGFDDEHDTEYMPPSTATQSRAARATRATPKKVASDVVTASMTDEELTLNGTPYGSTSHEEGVFGSLGVCGRKKPPGSLKSLPSPHLHSLPRLMRLKVLISLQVHQLVLSPWLPTNPTDGVSTRNIKCILMQSF